MQQQFNENMPMDMGGYMPPTIVANQADLVEKITPRKLLEELKHDLKREEYDYEKEIWYQPYGIKPYLNEEGISKVMAIARRYVNDNTIYSNLTIEEIRLLILQACYEMTLLLVLNYKKFEVDKSDLTSIKNLVIVTAFNSLKRAIGGTERKLLAKSINEQIISQQRVGTQEEKKSIFGGIPKLFK